MNPYRIYRDEWASVLSKQATAAMYETFVAMPFLESFSYRSSDILSMVLQRAAEQANLLGRARRPFASPTRADLPAGPAASSVITEEIALRILESHIFIADVTFENAGVLLETGVALGTKPSPQIILITQGPISALHFDLRNNDVVQYSRDGSVERIAAKLLGAAEAFEIHMARYLSRVTEHLTSDAHAVLGWYGRIRQQAGVYSLHRGNMGPHFADAGDDGQRRFDDAARELLTRELLWTDYRAGAAKEGDLFGMHATPLGWAVIEQIWPELRKPQQDIQAPSADKDEARMP